MAKKMWSKGHDKELQFNKKKQETKRALLDKLSELFFIVEGNPSYPQE